MKLLLTTLNSKFTHSSLALRYISGMLKNCGADVTLNEYTINNQLDYIVREIYTGHYDVVLFSVYIWNVESTNIIAKNLKKVAPHIKIFYGGPEVTYESTKFLKDHPFVDLIIRGEGEKSVQKLIETYLEKGYPADGQEDSFTGLKGINYRNTSGDIINTFDEPLIETLDIIPFPYESLEGLDNRILYYESSRGCPFDCQYCLSSTIKGVRFSH